MEDGTFTNMGGLKGVTKTKDKLNQYVSKNEHSMVNQLKLHKSQWKFWLQKNGQAEISIIKFPQYWFNDEPQCSTNQQIIEES